MGVNFRFGTTGNTIELASGVDDCFIGRDFANFTTLPDGLDAVQRQPVLRLNNTTTGQELYRWSNNSLVAGPGVNRITPSLFVGKNANEANGNQNPVPFGLVLRDTAGGWVAASNRYVIPVAGWYRVSVTGLIRNNAVLNPRVNGSRWFNGVHTVQSCYTTCTVEFVRNCVAGDFIDVESWNGGNVDGGTDLGPSDRNEAQYSPLGVTGIPWTYMCIDYIS